MGWAITGMGDLIQTFTLTDLKGTGHLEDLGVDGSIILKCILKK
jgi:hypothetical protein